MEKSFMPEIVHSAMALDGPICRVTITEDQADIYREGKISWKKGPLNIFLKDVTPYVIDRTLWAEIVSTDGLNRPEIGSVRAIRWFEPEEEKVKDGDSTEKIEKIKRRLTELNFDKDRLAYYYSGIETGAGPAVNNIREKIVFSGAMPDSYNASLDEILNVIEYYHKRLNSIEKEQKKCHEELEEIKVMTGVDFSSFRKKGGILVSMEAEKEGAGFLRCGYQVPCAQWRPQHEAHLLSEDKVILINYGVVWQNSGEDWNNAELILSTSKPSLGLDVLIPDEDIMRLRKKTSEEKKKIKIAVRDEEVYRTGVEEVSGEPPLPSDGGEALFYKITEKVTIPSTGRPHIINLGKYETDGTSSLVAIPELDNKVYLRTLVKNTQNKPFLAGPLSLHREGTFTGRGDLKFVGAGEDFCLWWGSEDLLRLERYVDKKEDKASLLHKRQILYKVKLHIRNLSGEEKLIKIQERIPVSELEEVKVTVKDLPEKPDKNGFVFINVSPGPSEEKEINYSYIMEIDKEVDYGF